MSNSMKFLPLFLLVTVFYFSVAATPAMAAEPFVNPVLKTSGDGCQTNNLRIERFNAEISADERLKVCQAIEKITIRLNSHNWSPALSSELRAIWQVFSAEAGVTLRLIPKGTTYRMLAMAEAFPAGTVGETFEASVYLRPEASSKNSFFQVLLHELRHVYDFHETWKNKGAIHSLEVERRAFLLMSRLTEETREGVDGIPKFWKNSWQKLPEAEVSFKRREAVEKYLRGSKYYRQMAENQKTLALDFSRFKGAIKSDAAAPPSSSASADNRGPKDPTRLPNLPALPVTAAVLPQKIQELSFNLEKPKNPRDEKEILRVALSNEKKLYYGMNNFVYDQKLEFQCWKKGKVAASVSENNTIARAGNGGALFHTAAFQPALSPSSAPCTLDSQNLKTDFTETFWVSPALEKMPIRFAGFVETDGKTLARYTVLQPDERLFNELANEYKFIKPFRVFVGTIFVSPEDGQIVKFWGTSFPEDTVTGSNSKKVWGSYSVTALRQKLDIDKGLWVTVYVGTVAVANISKSPRPFSYTVKFENYRQSTTDIRILDNDDVAQTSLVSRK